MSNFIFTANRAKLPNGQFVQNEEVEESDLDTDGYRWWFSNGVRMKRIYCIDGVEFGDADAALSYILATGYVEEPRTFLRRLPRLPDRKSKYGAPRSREKRAL